MPGLNGQGREKSAQRLGGSRVGGVGPWLLVCLLAAGCASSLTGRRQLLLVAPAQEMKLGAQAFDEIRAKEKACQDAGARQAVTALGARIASVSPQPKWPWTFELFDAPDTANAFALPGGKVGVYSGLLPVAATTAGLAAVMGHEVAHAILRHGAERMSQGLVVNMGIEAAGIAFENNEHKKTIMASLGLGAQLGVLLPYSREMESEADKMGLLYMAAAGYDPREAVAFWQRFQKVSGGGAPELLSTHPATETRIATLQAHLPEAIKLYERSARLGKGPGLSLPACGGAAAAAPPPPAPTPPPSSGGRLPQGR